MSPICDKWTGKPVDSAADLLPETTSAKCDECGTFIVIRCFRCGAPQCCPKCCAESEREAQDADARNEENLRKTG